MINLKDLFVRNPWWFGKSHIQEQKWPKRDLFEKIKKSIASTLAINILGLRRVGKSTIMKQLIAEILKDKKEKTNVFYYLFDYSSEIQTSEILDQILELYFSQILHKQVFELKTRIYIFLDEIQYINNYSAVVKKWYDLSGKKIKFILSGSQSLLLRGVSHESLAGRVFEFYLPPLNFGEFLRFKKEKADYDINFNIFNLKSDYPALLFPHERYKEKIKNLALEFISFGQFPETLILNNLLEKNSYIKEAVLGKVIEDIIKIYKIDKTEIFKLYTNHLFENTSSLFELDNLAREAGIQFVTADKFLSYLQNAYLFNILYKKHQSIIKRGRILKKLYSASTNFIFALSEEMQLENNSELFGKIVENLVFNLLSSRFSKLSFWRKGEKEIDFLIKNKDMVLPVEVKIRNTIKSSDYKTILDYCFQKNLKRGIIVSKNLLEKKTFNGIDLFFIPYYLLLFMD